MSIFLKNVDIRQIIKGQNEGIRLLNNQLLQSFANRYNEDNKKKSLLSFFARRE